MPDTTWGWHVAWGRTLPGTHRVKGGHGAVEEVILSLQGWHRVPKSHIAVLWGPENQTAKT